MRFVVIPYFLLFVMLPWYPSGTRKQGHSCSNSCISHQHKVLIVSCCDQPVVSGIKVTLHVFNPKLLTRFGPNILKCSLCGFLPILLQINSYIARDKLARCTLHIKDMCVTAKNNTVAARTCIMLQQRQIIHHTLGFRSLF